MHTRKNVESELQVVGRGSISINLDGEPCEVKVRFVEKATDHIPCVPHLDTLEWAVERGKGRHHHRIALVISWHVQDERTVEWTIIY